MARRWLLILFLAVIGKSQTLLQHGLRALQHGELTQARSDLEQAARAEPANPVIWSALAEVYFRSHEPSLASSAAATAEKNGNGNPLVLHALAVYFSEAGNFEKAGKLEQAFAESAKADRNAPARAATFYLKANNPQAALPLAKIAAEADPQTAFTWAQTFLKRQDFSPAADLLQTSLSKFPSDPQLTLALGVARYGQRRFDDAMDAFLKVIELDPQIDQPYAFIGRMLDQAGSRLPRIEQIFSKRAQENPEDAKSQFLLAKALLTADNKDANAEPLLRKSIMLDGSRWESHYELGALLADRHSYQEAAAELSRSIELNPDQPTSHYQLARVYDRLGQPERAREEREIHRRLTSSPPGTGMQ